jgi:5-methylcytosine-specific restriction protein B
MRPRAREDGGLDYPMVPGRFQQFCLSARDHEGLSVLIIDEINRANLARVFGELIYLLEYRDEKIALAGGAQPFSIPDSVRIIGTMNTADRSIALVDHALRRRFAFLELRPHYQVLRKFHADHNDGFDPGGLIDVLQDLNRRIDDPDYEIGISFFLRLDLAEHLPDIWQMEIEPYLDEYFFDQHGTVEEFRWEKIASRALK